MHKCVNYYIKEQLLGHYDTLKQCNYQVGINHEHPYINDSLFDI